MQKQTDFLIIGAGIAGLTAAYFLSEHGSVTVVTKNELKTANTYWAQGGIAAALTQEDSYHLHKEDTLKTGAGHCKEEAVEFLTSHAPKAIKFLKSIGLKLEEEPCLEAGHSMPRVWRSSDFTGRDIMEVLLKAVRQKRNIEIRERLDAAELIEKDEVCYGAFVRQTDQKELSPILASQTILATGGCGQLFGKTTNTLGSGGDGLALAVNAGLELADMEFIQFHPTAFAREAGGRHFLLSEVLRGAGAKIVNREGRSFLNQYDFREELAPRDVLSRAIFFEQMSGPVYLDMRSMENAMIKHKFPNIYKTLLKYELDLTHDLIPVTPVAHYACGGIPVNLKSETAMSGLHAVGEVACTGVHGANRLASNSLLEAILFSKNMADHLSNKPVSGGGGVRAESFETPSVAIEDMDQVKAYGKRIGQIMWQHVGIIRSQEGLERAKKEIVGIPARDYRVQHRQLACYKIIEACMRRPESLGCHYMEKEML
jgi:L-aspartate oxidase